tara:strand:+ start:84 stop:281 length:198 start_codon:yes stop_codon:yes gene_type:complete
MIEYKLVSTPRPDRFEETMNLLLNDGWDLKGNLVFSNGVLNQSLTRNKINKPDNIKKKSSASVPK